MRKRCDPDSGVCKINARRESNFMSTMFAPPFPNINVETRSKQELYEIGRLFCKDVHSGSDAFEHCNWGEGGSHVKGYVA